MDTNYDNHATWTPRPANVTYEPQKGDVWVFYDAEDEGPVEWSVDDRTDDGFVKLTKLTGKDVGYRRNYEVYKMVQGQRWKPKEGAKPAGFYTDTQDPHGNVLFNCPSCGGARPIRVGDYMCVECREGLDKC